MLPFMQKKSSGGIAGSVDFRSKPDPEPAVSGDAMELMAATFLIHAIETKDPEAVCQAIKALMDIYESQPHQEYGA